MRAVVHRLLDLLTPQERQRLGLVLCAVVLHALVEVVGIASILPFLTLVGNPAAVQENAILKWFFDTMRFTSVNWFLFFLGFVVLGVLVLSNALAALATWAMLRFSWMRNHSLSRRLLAIYLHHPYVYFLNQNTAEIGRNILMETQQVVHGLIIPGMQILAKGFVILSIFGLLVAVNPLLALIMTGVLGTAYGVVYALVRHKLAQVGKERLDANRERFKTVNEAFGTIKLVKLLGRDRYFTDRYRSQSYRYSDRMTTAALISSLPRYAMETIAFGGILIVVLYLLRTRGGLGQVLPLAGLYAFAGYRLMPALQAMFFGAAQVRSNVAGLDALHEVLQGSAGTDSSSMYEVRPLPFRETIRLRAVSFRYPGAGLAAVEDLDLAVRIGSTVGFAGRTGSGKTTAVDLILGLLRPVKGSLLVDGAEITNENLPAWQRDLGYVPQEIYLTDDTVARNIAFGIPDARIDTSAVERAAQVANIHEFIVESLPDGYGSQVGERGVRLSGGERQRIGIARALYHDPAVLVLDEATSALDSATEEAVFQAIRNVARTKTLIIIAHRLTTIVDCDVIYVMDNGRVIAQGSYAELMTTSAEFRDLAKAPNHDT
jgi:ABC-type multidrug transport system fused ATPase/permease subunit